MSSSSSSGKHHPPSIMESLPYPVGHQDNDSQICFSSDDPESYWQSIINPPHFPQQMEEFSLPPSQSSSVLPEQPHLSQFVESRHAASHHHPQNPPPRKHSPHTLPDPPKLQPATPIAPRTPIAPKPFESPMSVSTPMSVHQATPHTTPTPQVPLTPVTPVSEHFNVISAIVGQIPKERIDSHHKDSVHRALDVANEKKRQLREQLKRSPPPSRGRSSTGAIREAAVSRTKAEEYRNALEDELRIWIQNCLVLSDFVAKFLTTEQENASKRARVD